MNLEFFNGSTFHDWILFPAMIFFARLSDVSLGTLRGVLAAKGKKRIVPFIGFFEVLIWLFAISQLMHNLTNFMCYFAWASGYACGTFIGLTIEERLAIGTQLVRIITNQNCDELTESLKKENRGYTIFDGMGSRGPVKMIFAIVKRKEVVSVEALIERYNPNAFYTVEDVKEAEKTGYAKSKSKFDFFAKVFPVVKGK